MSISRRAVLKGGVAAGVLVAGFSTSATAATVGPFVLSQELFTLFDRRAELKAQSSALYLDAIYYQSWDYTRVPYYAINQVDKALEDIASKLEEYKTAGVDVDAAHKIWANTEKVAPAKFAPV